MGAHEAGGAQKKGSQRRRECKSPGEWRTTPRRKFIIAAVIDRAVVDRQDADAAVTAQPTS